MSASVLTECVEAQSEGGLVGCCGMIGDEVWVEERGAGKRSVTGAKTGEKKRESLYLPKPLSLSFFFSVP